MLEDLILKRCGPAIGVSAQIAFPRPTMEQSTLQAFLETLTQCPDPALDLREGQRNSGPFLSPL